MQHAWAGRRGAARCISSQQPPLQVSIRAPCHSAMIFLLLLVLGLLELTACDSGARLDRACACGRGGSRRGTNTTWDDVIVVPKDYNGDVPPTLQDGAPVTVSIQLEILRDLMVDEMQGEITIDSFLTTRWKDSRIKVNFTAFNASAMGEKVIVNPRTDRCLWKPDIVFVPMEQLALTRGMKPVKLLALSKDGELTYKIGCTITLLCAMDFSNFPFDVQECKWRIYSFRHSHRFVNLTWGARPLRFRSAQGRITEMKQPQFGMRFITGKDEDEYSEHKSNMLLLTVLLHRDIRSHILVTYFPSALFVSVSWGSFLVSPEVVPGRMVLLVTTLLTLVTMLNTVRCGVPSNEPQSAAPAYKQTTPESEEIKPVEDAEEGHPSWLPYCLRTKPGAFDMLSFILFPLFFLCFNIVYWINCMSEMSKHLEKVGLNEIIYDT
ncbi:hypothetical protein B566_EDAN004406 [Ephemera danica]|nr:hypothetical protein B566_EDAN004406 [Ephemera danica]